MSAPIDYEVTYKGESRVVRLKPLDDNGFEVTLDEGDPIRIDLTDLDGDQLLMRIGQRVFEVETSSNGDELTLMLHNWEHKLTIEDRLKKRLQSALGAAGPAASRIVADMPGKMLQVLVKEGDVVKKGDGIFIIEAMKMENEIKAAADVRIAKIHVQPDQTVETGDPLAELEEP